MKIMAVHLQIFGKVQGVGYRASTQIEASRFGLLGWVKNCLDGSVELWAEGPEPKIHELIAWCKKGPPRAVIKDIQIEKPPASGAFQNFQIKI